jgi:hypothetical protein
LKDPHGEKRHAGGFIRGRGVLEEEPMVADEAVAVSEHKGEADCVEENSAKASIHHALDEHIHRFTGTTEAGFEHREPDLHSEYQERGDERPRRVYRINDIVPLEVGVGCEGMAAHEDGHEGHDRQHRRNADSFAGE